MPRLFWAVLGATAGVLAVRKVTKTAQQYTPEGVAHGLSSVGEGLREFAVAVREGMAVRETELRVALGIDTGTMDPSEAERLLENPTEPREVRARDLPIRDADR